MGGLLGEEDRSRVTDTRRRYVVGLDSDLLKFLIPFFGVGAGKDARGIKLGRVKVEDGPRISVRFHPLHLLSYL